MSAAKVLDLAVQQGLLDEKVIAELRRQIAESKFIVTPEAIAKVLVDHGHVTPFQARKLVSQSLESADPAATAAFIPAPPAAPQAPRSSPAEPFPPARPRSQALDDLSFADDVASAPAWSAAGPAAEDDIIDLEPVAPAPPARKPSQQKPTPLPPAAKKPQPPARPQPAPPQPELEEVIDLEPALPPAQAKPSKPTAPKPTAPRPSAPKPMAEQPVVLQPIAPAPPVVPEADLVPLTPIAPRPSPVRERAPATTVGATPTMVAVEPAPPLVTGLQPLTVLGTESVLTPLDPLASDGGPKEQPRTRQKKGPKNVWDSPLLLIGGGGLGVLLLAAALLFYSLTRGSAAEMLTKADKEYETQSYANAIVVYDKFLKNYPDDPAASRARVRRGMAELRQVADSGKNPRQALKTAQEVLPKLEIEEQFNDARLELSSLLPDIAAGFAKQAAEAVGTEKKEELVKLAGDAMALVNNASYIPSSLRKDREARIAAVMDELKVAQRSIDQDKDLATAIAKIGEAAMAGNAAEAYRLRSELLRVYPGLEAHADLTAAIRNVGERERQLVQNLSPATPAATDDDAPAATRTVLALREGPPAGAAAGSPRFALVEGAVYSLDAASGSVLWRRHVGYQTLAYPLALPADSGADALVVDARTHQALRLNGASGAVIWRQPIGEPFFQPSVVGERVYITTRAGRLLDIDAASGEVTREAKLPQAATSPAYVVSRQNRPLRLLQLGEHSTLFLLEAESLQASETFYIGHKPGAIFVPPAAVLDHVLVVESPADDHSLIHVLAPDEKTRRLVEVGRPFRLKGRITTPLATSGRRVAAVTDLGQVAVYEVDAGNKQQPLRPIGGMEATEKAGKTTHVVLDGNRLWIGGVRATGLQINAGLQQIDRKWTRHQDDAFLGPFQVEGASLLHVRRRAGWPGVVVESCNADSGETQWTTQLAVPIVALAVSEARKSVDALTEGGRLYQLSGELLKGGIVDAPPFPLPRGSGPAILPAATLSTDGGTLLWAQTQRGGRVFAYNVNAGVVPADSALPDAEAAAAAPPQLMGQRLLVPTTAGSVALLDAGSGMQSVQPFLPPLMPGLLPLFTRPAILGDETSFLITDGRRALYRVGLKDQPQPHLALSTEVPTETPITSSLAAAGGIVYGVKRGEAADSLVAIDPATLPEMNELPLQGRVESGPYALGGLVLLAAEPEGLVCIEAGPKIRWQQPLTHGPLAGPPLAVGEDELLLIHQAGIVRRLSAESGDELASIDAGQPLGPAARVLGSQLFLTTSDGVVQRVALPTP